VAFIASGFIALGLLSSSLLPPSRPVEDAEQ